MNFFRRFFPQPRPELVRYYDAATKLVTVIPKAELKPGVILVRAANESESMYMDAAELKLGPVRHSSLSGELRADIAQLTADLADVFPQSLAEWEDGFQRDPDPEQEVASWIHLAAILKKMTADHGYDTARRKECFRILVACFTGARETVRERSDPELLPAAHVDQAIRYFFEGGYG